MIADWLTNPMPTARVLKPNIRLHQQWLMDRSLLYGKAGSRSGTARTSALAAPAAPLLICIGHLLESAQTGPTND
ncbi:MAG: hypothetical protein K2Y27_30660 [Xanthobacteraceae bacterium]|nr:hypothetical protein [Xanthobacteraceae bacterium]